MCRHRQSDLRFDLAKEKKDVSHTNVAQPAGGLRDLREHLAANLEPTAVGNRNHHSYDYHHRADSHQSQHRQKQVALNTPKRVF